MRDLDASDVIIEWKVRSRLINFSIFAVSSSEDYKMIQSAIIPSRASEELLQRLRNGDYEAFSAIYRRYSPRIYRTVLTLLGNSDMAEDVVQDLFLTIWERRATIDPTRNFDGYIAVIARNLAYRYVQEAVTRFMATDDIDKATDKLAAGSAADSAEAASLNQYIMRVLAAQPEMRRKVFMMSRFDNMTYAEIAHSLNISERTVEAHIYAMVRELKKLLEYVPAATALLYLSVKLC